MEKPSKPELDYRQKNGSYGEVIVQLTDDSEKEWSEYMRNLNSYRRSMGSLALGETMNAD